MGIPIVKLIIFKLNVSNLKSEPNVRFYQQLPAEVAPDVAPPNLPRPHFVYLGRACLHEAF